ncbi:MAG: aryl-sulfate sulfotransferase [Dehalococcoidia bacterium]|nr:aryl-sulfate sulfotransferase [Dehalococcoidia bacterium]
MTWSRFSGLAYIDEDRACDGYTLITPPGDSAVLLDMRGVVVHRWRFPDHHPGYARLLPNGNLLMRAIVTGLPPAVPVEFGEEHPPLAEHVRRMAGGATHLLEVDWDGKVVWSYENGLMHHDFARLENGNTLAVTWSELEPLRELEVQGGLPRRPGEVLPPLLGDTIIEVDSTGAEVWWCDIGQLLDPAADRLCPLEPRWAWTHVNGISLTRAGELLVSCRNIDRVLAIDRATGEITWKWAGARHQHSPVEAANGNVLVFDNGVHRSNVPRSRVVEVERATGKVAWSYEGDPPESFFSWNVSNADELANGNILVCEGALGRLFEVTRSGDIVWEWFSPYRGRIAGRSSAIIFRAHRYTPDHPGLTGRDLRAE